MKKLLTFMVVVLAVPAIAMAAKTTAITSGGSASLTYTIGAAPATIPIEWSVTADDTTIFAAGGSVYGPSSLTVTGLTPQSPFSSWVTFGVGDVANGDALNVGGEWGRYNTSDTLNLPVGTTTLMTATINGIDGLGVGVYTLYLGDSVANPAYGTGWYSTGDAGGDPIAFDSNGDLTITIEDVPEPATMLLLAGALPFLRRRTA